METAYKAHNGSHQSAVATSGVRLPYQRARLVRMLELLEAGRKQMEAIGHINDEFEYLVNLGRFMECFVVTGIHAKDWFKVVSLLPVADSREEVERLISEGERILKAERANVERAIPIVQMDSRLGWDPRMEYVCDTVRLEWKLRLLDYVMTTELDKFRKPNRWTAE